MAIRISLKPDKGQSAQAYSALLQDAFNRKQMVRVRGPEHMLLSALDKPADRVIQGKKKKTSTSMHGTISKCTDIDLTGEWFNSDTLKVATANDRKEIAIPPRLKGTSKNRPVGDLLAMLSGVSWVRHGLVGAVSAVSAS